MKIIARGGESYDMAHARISKDLGHDLEFEYVDMCISIPKCKKCKKAGWNYLEERCEGA